MTLKEILEKCKLCKVCGAKNKIFLSKGGNLSIKSALSKLAKKQAYFGAHSFPCFSSNGETINLIEKVGYDITVGEIIIDINSNKIQISGIEAFKPLDFSINVNFACPIKNEVRNKEYDEDDKFNKTISHIFTDGFDEDLETFESFKASKNSHYFAISSTELDCDNKEVISSVILKEYYENNDFIVEKNVNTNKTYIIKKEKKVILPFVYEKDIEDFDFSKLDIMADLLK